MLYGQIMSLLGRKGTSRLSKNSHSESLSFNLILKLTVTFMDQRTCLKSSFSGPSSSSAVKAQAAPPCHLGSYASHHWHIHKSQRIQCPLLGPLDNSHMVQSICVQKNPSKHKGRSRGRGAPLGAQLRREKLPRCGCPGSKPPVCRSLLSSPWALPYFGWTGSGHPRMCFLSVLFFCLTVAIVPWLSLGFAFFAYSWKGPWRWVLHA